MIYNKVRGQIEATMDDLQFIVTIANMAGYLENAERINVEDDSQLTEFCVNLVEHYYRNTEVISSFFKYAEEALLEKYGRQQ